MQYNGGEEVATMAPRRAQIPDGNGFVHALLYTRVSSDEQAKEGISLPAQLGDCRRYAARQQDWVIHRELQDVLSGKRDDRRGYQQLLDETRRLKSEGKR